MKLSSIFIQILLVLVVGSSFAFAQSLPELEKVKEIKLLESTRDDVRRILAKYKLQKIENYVFQPRGGTIYKDLFISDKAWIWIEYSGGNCNEKFEYWDTDVWKVTGVDIDFQKEIAIKNTAFILSSYKKEKTYSNIPNHHTYYNKDDGIGIEVEKGFISKISLIPARTKNYLLCDKKDFKKYFNSKGWFSIPLRKRILHICYAPTPADVTDVNIGFDKIQNKCNSNLSKFEFCLDENNVIEISTIATNPYNEVLTYNYAVTGGKIVGIDGKSVGQSNKVLWDLSNVKPGTYTITVAVDNGCGFCGKTVTKTIRGIECSDCRQTSKP